MLGVQGFGQHEGVPSRFARHPFGGCHTILVSLLSPKPNGPCQGLRDTKAAYLRSISGLLLLLLLLLLYYYYYYYYIIIIINSTLNPTGLLKVS